MIYPEPEKTAPGRRAAVTTLLESKSVSAALLSQARTILKHSADLAQDVLHARKHFDVAWRGSASSKSAAS